jgi:hypothetical protein
VTPVRDPWLAAIVVLAATLRLVGIGHGLPDVYNPDEVNIMARALSVARDLNPHYFLYPSFFFYFLFGAMGGLYVLGRLTGAYGSLGEFQTQFFEDPSAFYLAGRLVGVVTALLAVIVTYRLAHRHFGRTVARASSLFLAVAYFHVRDAHYVKHDVPVSLLIVVALVFFDRAMDKPSWNRYLAAGAAMGVAFATHYYTIFLAPTFVLCHWITLRFREFGKLAVAAVASAVTFFVLSPYVLLELPVALEHMRANRQVVVDRSFDAGTSLFPSLPAYVKFLAEQGLGYMLLGLMVVGWILMTRRGWRPLAIWGAFPLMFVVLISYTFFAGRYLNPIAPSLAVAGGLAIGAIHRRWGSRVAMVVTLVACIQPLYNDIQIDRLFSGEDTRTVAQRWILDNVPDGAAIALQSYSVPVPQSKDSFQASLASNDALDELERRGKYSYLAEVAEKSRPSYPLFFLGKGDEKNRIYFDYSDVADRELEPLLSRDVKVVIIRYAPQGSPPQVSKFFDGVRARGKLLKRISPFANDAPGIAPYLDNEDWPARSALTHKGPLVEIWSLGELP